MTSDTGSGAPRGDIASPRSGHGATSERAKLVLRYDAEKKRVIYQPVSIEPREITPRIIREDNYGGLS